MGCRKLGELKGYHDRYLEDSFILAVLNRKKRTISVLIMMVDGSFDFHGALLPLSFT